MNQKQQKLYDWLKSLILLSRGAYETLSSNERIFVSNLEYLSVPCQIDVLWVYDEHQKHLQLFLVKHDENEDDLSINVNGPFATYNTEGIQKIESFLNQPKFLVPMDPSNTSIYKVRLENVLNDHLDTLKTSSQSASGKGAAILCKNSKNVIWNVTGKIQETDVREHVRRVIKDAKMNSAIHPYFKEHSKLIETSEYLPALGGFIYPPIWIGSIPEIDPKDKFKRFPLRNFITYRVLKYDDRYLKITSDGYLILSFRFESYKKHSQHNSKFDKAAYGQEMKLLKQVLNTLFSTLLIMGTSIHSLEANPFCSTNYTITSGRIYVIDSFPMSGYGSDLQKARDEYFRLETLQSRRQVISEDYFNRSLKYSTKITDPELLGNDPLHLLQSYTNLQRQQFMQSSTLNWIIIENYIDKLWNQSKRNGKIQSKKNTVFVKLSELERVSMLKNGEFNVLDKLRKVRNKTVHEGYTCSKEEAETGFNSAKEIMQNQLQDLMFNVKVSK